MTRLTTLDLPHFHRATIGFDQMFNELERQIANVLRKIARDIVETNKKQIKVTKTKVHDLLGASRFHSELAERATEPTIAGRPPTPST